MARIRSSKPEWWAKEKWCRLPRDVRSTYKGIWEVMADDQGRFQADPRKVKADVWPFDDDITAKKLEQWLTQLATVIVTRDDGYKVPALQFYIVDGVRYGYMPGFEKHQKISHPTPSKLPKPPDRFRKSSGAASEELRPDNDKDIEEDIDKDKDIDTEGAAAAVPVIDMALIARLVAPANRGLAEHDDPSRRQSVPRILASSAKSRSAVEKIVAAGVSIEFAESHIYHIAKTCKPDGSITSLEYFATAITRAWQVEQARADANGVTPKRSRGKRPPSQYDYTETTEDVRWDT